MDINKNNYEAFFLDYIEGTLSTEKVAELLLFLERNPHLQEELDEFENIEIQANNDSYSAKNELKRTINKDNIDDYIIASIEGINTPEDEEELTHVVNQNKENQSLYNRYQKTVLAAPNVVYPNKYQLKKKNRLVILYPLIGAAASLLLFFWFSNNNVNQEYSPLAISEVDTSSTPTRDYVAIQPKFNENTNPEKQISNPIKQKTDSAIQFVDVNPIEFIANNTTSDSIINDSVQLDNFNQQPLIVKDSTQNDFEDNLAMESSNDNQNLTLNEWTNLQIRKKVLNQDSENTEKIEKDEVISAVANGLNKLSKQEIAYNNNSSEDYVTKGISIGNFEFSRTKRKKF